MGGSTVQQSKSAALARMLAQKKLSFGFFSGPCTTASPLSAGSGMVFPVPDMHTGKHSCNQSVLLPPCLQAVPGEISLTFPKLVLAHTS